MTRGGALAAPHKKLNVVLGGQGGRDQSPQDEGEHTSVYFREQHKYQGGWNRKEKDGCS